MPIIKTKSGYKFGKHGKVYKTKKAALRQARAMFANGYRAKK